MTEPSSDEPPQQWLLLTDPAWAPETKEDNPPPELVVGGWPVEEDGNTLQFQPNPDYHPAEGGPTDPVDAVAQLISQGRVNADQVLDALRDTTVAVAMTTSGEPLVVPAPDQVNCLAVATAGAHRERVHAAAEWRQVDAAGLAELLPPEIDVLINPGGPASMRLLADAIRRTASMLSRDTPR